MNITTLEEFRKKEGAIELAGAYYHNDILEQVPYKEFDGTPEKFFRRKFVLTVLNSDSIKIIIDQNTDQSPFVFSYFVKSGFASCTYGKSLSTPHHPIIVLDDFFNFITNLAKGEFKKGEWNTLKSEIEKRITENDEYEFRIVEGKIV